MAARVHAAASVSPNRTVFLCFLSRESQCLCTSSSSCLSVLKLYIYHVPMLLYLSIIYIYIINFIFLLVLTCIFVIVAFDICMCMYIYLICIICIYVLLLVFNVICMHQGSESNTISILCMYVCTVHMAELTIKLTLTFFLYFMYWKKQLLLFFLHCLCSSAVFLHCLSICKLFVVFFALSVHM